MNAPLTDAEIAAELPKYEKLSHNYAKCWHRRVGDMVELEGLQSVIFEQAWRALGSWRPDGGACLNGHVKTAMWYVARGEALRQFRLWARRAKHETAWPQTEKGGEVVAAPPDLAIQRSEEIAAGRRLFDLMHQNLHPHTVAAITRCHLGGESMQVVGRDLGISREAVRKRVLSGLRRLRGMATYQHTLKSLKRISA